MTKEERDKKDKFENPVFSYAELEKVEGSDFQFTLQWGAKGVGFGEFTFFFENDKLICDNEYMSKNFIKKALCAMVDNCRCVNPKN